MSTTDSNIPVSMVQVNLVGLRTIMRREIARILRIWAQTLLPPAMTISLYFIIFGSLIGSRIGDMGGFDYMQFIVPGLIMMSVIQNSYGNIVSSFFGAKFGRHIEELLISPLPNWVILAGYITGSMFRGLLVGAVVTLVALLFTKLHVHSWVITISVVVLTSMVFSLAGMINAIYAQKFDDITIVPTFVLTPLTYLGGVFYSVSLLPQFWKAFSSINPILYMVYAFRYGMLGVSDVPLLPAFAIILVFVVLLSGVCLYLLHKGVGLRS
jgi:ABC-2 type transport system permease protein